MAQLMPLPLTVSCFRKIQIGLIFLVPAHPGRPGQRAIKRVCECVCVQVYAQRGVEGELEVVSAVGGAELVEVEGVGEVAVNERAQREAVRPATGEVSHGHSLHQPVRQSNN